MSIWKLCIDQSESGVRQSEGRQHQVAQCDNFALIFDFVSHISHIVSNYQPLLNAVRRQRAASFIPLRPAGGRENCSFPSVMTLTCSHRIGNTQLELPSGEYVQGAGSGHHAPPWLTPNVRYRYQQISTTSDVCGGVDTLWLACTVFVRI